MHAAIVSVTITDPAADPERKGLHEGVIPMVKSQPGFLAGYWMAMSGNRGLSVVAYDSEKSARAALSAAGVQPGAAPVPGVRIDDVQVAEVIGHA